MFYRVQAIGFDNQPVRSATRWRSRSATCAAARAGDHRGDGTAARRTYFAPGAPEEDSTDFVVLRADDEHAPGGWSATC